MNRHLIFMFLALILGAVQKIRALTQYRGILRKCLIVSRKIGQHTETNTGAERGQVPDLCNEGCFTYLMRLDRNPGSVPASNLIFPRSRNLDELEGDFNRLASECWPFHQAVVNKLGIDVIVCLGGKVGSWVRHKLDAHTPVDETVSTASKRRYRNRAYMNSDGLHVVVALHPSWFAWTSPSYDPSELIIRAIQKLGSC